ncbi:MAG: pyrroline-5-carboxylate reductase [Candidatus Omnitrophica bacterium]|nr:pyrroline-5-carboxylate reductase [Candidatus Omnitrophota bacterium]
MNKVVGIVGCGNMGFAIANQIKKRFKVFCFDRDPTKLSGLDISEKTEGIVDLFLKCDCLIIAVKPQDIIPVLEEIKKQRQLQDKFFISIAAGISTKYIEKVLGKVRVVRAMPNMPFKIGKGLTCLSKGKFAKQEDFKFAADLFECGGNVLELKEDMMDAATATSGSAPGWYFELVSLNYPQWKKDPDFFTNKFAEDLKNAAQELGFEDFQSELIASTTASACAFMLIKLNNSPEELRDQVASKGGTTEAGLTVLRNGGTLLEAARAARERAKELLRE